MNKWNNKAQCAKEWMSELIQMLVDREESYEVLNEATDNGYAENEDFHVDRFTELDKKIRKEITEMNGEDFFDLFSRYLDIVIKKDGT